MLRALLRIFRGENKAFVVRNKKLIEVSKKKINYSKEDIHILTSFEIFKTLKILNFFIFVN